MVEGLTGGEERSYGRVFDNERQKRRKRLEGWPWNMGADRPASDGTKKEVGLDQPRR